LSGSILRTIRRCTEFAVDGELIACSILYRLVGSFLCPGESSAQNTAENRTLWLRAKQGVRHRTSRFKVPCAALPRFSPRLVLPFVILRDVGFAGGASFLFAGCRGSASSTLSSASFLFGGCFGGATFRFIGATFLFGGATFLFGGASFCCGGCI